VSDHKRYQTVYARETGSVAAPTAGLHFTDEILKKLTAKGVIVVPVTLHVGLGTFLPVRTNNITEHKMHSEIFFLANFSRDAIHQAKKEGRRITAVGTTSLRVLESPADGNGVSNTDIFIYPPYEFKIVDRLITNFHQPESTLLMLVSAFAGREFILSAYQEAIEKQYRLFSYGDCMMVA
jgi:S-adenosylmethionine:tRNA ribosyltransferase-isomerase